MDRNQRELKAYQNARTVEQLAEREKMFGPQTVSDKQPNRQVQPKQNQELLCACNGLKCAGICRETHLHRPRFTNPTAKAINKSKATKDVPVRKQWAEKCPEAYTNDQKPNHYRS
ncbi:hypothetical protein LCGC14_0767080 [marine sediment metagenome]|uniref:Uncharacterized protein n=1 Tax=marine sediment metagenome TaxID=412755 RepID=A0A0F9Q3N6_9ZZZZ